MRRVGDDTAGFSVDLPGGPGIVVKGWGFWRREVAAPFAGRVVEVCRSQPRGAGLRLDMSELKPMREEGQQSFRDLLRSLPGLGLSRVLIITGNPLTRMQLTRLATDTGTYDSIEWASPPSSLGRDK
jgi:hypothetical protein